MRVAIIAETFLPLVNGVTHSLQRVLEHLALRGDEVLVIAPAAGDTEAADFSSTAHIVRLPSVPLAGYPDIRLAVGGTSRVRKILAAFDPDVVHLASPFELGRRAIRAAAQLGIPTVAIYQTDVPGYLGKYGLPFLEGWAWQRVIGIHSAATLTLAPSLSAAAQLRSHGVRRITLWGRGVDTARFHPSKRSAAFRAAAVGDRRHENGHRLIGYVGRLATEKQVEDLAVLHSIPGTSLVIIGDGPQRESLEALLPDAHFTGFLTGDALAIAMASLDLFVHPGELETFCQTIQEAMSSGVPVVATGRGGPVDLVDSSRTGWLYTPGDLGQLRGHVQDLMGDDAKRAAFAEAAFDSVQGRTWPVVCELLLHHYHSAISLNAELHQHARR